MEARKGKMVSMIAAFKKEPVLTIAALAAVISCIFVPPDAGYASYVDFRTLALLYCLMVVVSGLRQAGLFSYLAQAVCRKASGIRSVGILLVLISFFSAMLITNDVALLTFVPFAVIVLGMAGRKKELIYIVVLQTAAANLGSMLTPVGNPQNLYLYSRYNLGFGDFLSITFPVWAASLILLTAACFLLPPGQMKSDSGGEMPYIDKKSFWMYLGLFAVCLLVVLRVFDWPVMLGIVIAVLLVLDRRTLVRADYMLLLTFVAFFIFSGNLARVEAVDHLLRNLLEGREYVTSLAASQVISNVPAALLLSGFTEKSHELLLGVNVGGLGTPIASLASLISMKLYAKSEGANVGKYLLEFTAVNVLLLAVLSVLVKIL